MRSLDPFTPKAPFQRFLVAAVFIAIAPVALSAQPDPHAIAAVSVSPGGLEGDSKTAPRCPTFSWGLLLADEVEFAVYDATAAGDLDPSAHRLHEFLPGSVTSWTPPAETCFEAGATYAWSVRGLIGGEAAGGWSAPRTFEVAAAPTDEEIREALETLARARDSRSSSPLPLESSPKTLGRSPKNDQLAPPAAGGVSSLTPPVQKEFSVESSMGTSTALYAKNLTGQAGYFDGDIAIDGLIEAAGSMAIGYAPSGFNPAPVVDAQVLGTNQFASAVRGTGSGGSEGHLGRGNFGVFGDAADGGGIGVQGVATSADSVGVKGVNTSGGKAGEFLGDVGVDGKLRATGAVIGHSSLQGGNTSAAILGFNYAGGPAGLFVGDIVLEGELDCSYFDGGCVGPGDIRGVAVRGRNIEPGAVESDKIADGAILPQHLTSLYSSHLYARESLASTLDTFAHVEVFCDDADDLPIQGYCPDSNDATSYSVKAFEPLDWDSSSKQSGWRCRVRNESGGNAEIKAGILCLDVP